MRGEIRLVYWTVATVVVVIIATTWGSTPQTTPPEMRTKLLRASYLYFRNVRSADYEIREFDGMTVYLPEERSDTGWFQIVVLWRDEEAYVVWETPDSLSHEISTRPDGGGLWDPDTSRMPTHWWIAYRVLQSNQDVHYSIKDYFEMVRATPEHFDAAT